MTARKVSYIPGAEFAAIAKSVAASTALDRRMVAIAKSVTASPALDRRMVAIAKSVTASPAFGLQMAAIAKSFTASPGFDLQMAAFMKSVIATSAFDMRLAALAAASSGVATADVQGTPQELADGEVSLQFIANFVFVLTLLLMANWVLGEVGSESGGAQLSDLFAEGSIEHAVFCLGVARYARIVAMRLGERLQG